VKRKRLGEVLQDRGKISSAALQQLLETQKNKVVRLGELILARGLVEKSALVAALEESCRVPYLDCTDIRCEKAALMAVRRSVAERLCVLPVRIDHSTMVMAMSEPQDGAAIDELQFLTGMKISPRLAFRHEIISVIPRVYEDVEFQEHLAEYASPSPSIPAGPNPEMEFTSTSTRQSNRDAIREVQAELSQKKTPAVRLVSEIIQAAMTKHASDIHIEPQSKGTAVRIRVDGMLREMKSLPRAVHNQLISRIKILSDMDIAERRTPQDGAFQVKLGARQLDLRVSTLPTQFGEKVVMRLLESNAPLLSFADLGFSQSLAESVSRILAMPQGMLLVTGPTGSGKSSTLYSALNYLRKSSLNIVTVEDPIEYMVPGINQVQVQERAGLTFASCLRSILRQDPNVIMLGEIRDRETAEISMKAAQTGHFVLSTLHTNDSIGAVTRLLDLGIPAYMVAASVTGVLAQRLVRKLCGCHAYERLSPEMALRLIEAGMLNPPETLARPVGCPNCDLTGYKGRIGVYELLTINETIRSMIHTNSRAEQIRDAARRAGMRSMQEDAIMKVQAGITTLEEVQGVIPFDSVIPASCACCAEPLMPSFQYCPACGARVDPTVTEKTAEFMKSLTERLASN
jgi:type IV pilus assembly protein PilB